MKPLRPSPANASTAIWTIAVALSLCALADASAGALIVSLPATPGLTENTDPQAVTQLLSRISVAARHLGLVRDSDWRSNFAGPAAPNFAYQSNFAPQLNSFCTSRAGGDAQFIFQSPVLAEQTLIALPPPAAC